MILFRFRADWGLSQEEAETFRLAVSGPKAAKVAKARVNWADLAEDSDEEVSESWKWS